MMKTIDCDLFVTFITNDDSFDSYGIYMIIDRPDLRKVSLVNSCNMTGSLIFQMII